MLKNLVLNNRLLILLDQCIFSGTSFIMTIFLARTLDHEAFGVYSAIVLGAFLFISLSSALIIQPFQVNLPKQENFLAYIDFTFISQLILLLFTLVVIAPFIHYLPIKNIDSTTLYYLFGYIFHDYLRKVLLALDKTKETLILDLLSNVGQLIFIIYFFISKCTFDLSFLFAILSITYVPSLLFSIYILKPKKSKFSDFKKFFLMHFYQGKWLFMTALIQWWSGNLFVVASGYYLGSIALGALRLAQSLFGVLNLLLQTFENYVLPQTAFHYAESKEAALQYLSKMTRSAGLIFIVFMLIIFLFADEIMKLAGGDTYLEYAYLLRGMTILYCLIYIGQPIRIGIRIMALNNYFFYGYLLCLLFSLVSSDYLLTHYQLFGALSGLIITQLILVVFWQLILFKKQFNLWKSFISF